ncbi:DUF998 domain-containing protein [Nocardiopsis trehalosi]|uniref:DUF998 domain-containing protein n=1 Tax=Nocardiopsis trehalosi TaxID=109329 RepID=UPI0009FC425B|nr:DUF998 domain-containing protein [Nocardiopsis trehalosi]
MGPHLLLACGAAAGPLFTLGYLAAGAHRPDYRPLRHPVSSLALGPGAWVQTANFLAAGGLTLAGAVGLWQAGASHWTALLVGGWAIGLLGAGAFRTDPVSGYPPGTPERLRHHSGAGSLHDGFSLAGFAALAAACFVSAAAGPPAWAGYAVASGVLFAAAMVLSSAAFDRRVPWRDHGGLVQRVGLTIGWTWQTVFAGRLLLAA